MSDELARSVEDTVDSVDVDVVDLVDLADPVDLAAWAEFLPTVRVGGALPVTFRLADDDVIVEVIVPFVPPLRQPSVDPNKIPLQIAEGFPVPVSGRYKLPAFRDRGNAANFLRYLVFQVYKHELDEQFRVGITRPFAPDHETRAHE